MFRAGWPDPQGVLGGGHFTTMLGNQRVFGQQEEHKKKTRIAKTSKFFLFFPPSEKRSPPFPNDRGVVPAKESFLPAPSTQTLL